MILIKKLSRSILVYFPNLTITGIQRSKYLQMSQQTLLHHIVLKSPPILGYDNRLQIVSFETFQHNTQMSRLCLSHTWRVSIYWQRNNTPDSRRTSIPTSHRNHLLSHSDQEFTFKSVAFQECDYFFD